MRSFSPSDEKMCQRPGGRGEASSTSTFFEVRGSTKFGFLLYFRCTPLYSFAKGSTRGLQGSMSEVRTREISLFPLSQRQSWADWSWPG